MLSCTTRELIGWLEPMRAIFDAIRLLDPRENCELQIEKDRDPIPVKSTEQPPLTADEQKQWTEFFFGASEQTDRTCVLLEQESDLVRLLPIYLTCADGNVKECLLELRTSKAHYVWSDRLSHPVEMERLLELNQDLYVDSLSKAFLRRFYDERQFLRRITAQLPCPMVFIMIDLFRFKHINDRYGHPVGDRVLEGVVRELKARIRVCDMVIRLGGDEFLLVLPNAYEQGAKRILEELTTSVQYRLLCEDVTEDMPAINAGYAFTLSFDGSEDSIHSLYTQADRNMYRHKLQGYSGYQKSGKENGGEYMTIRECYASFGGDFADVKSRLMRDELIVKFSLRFLQDENYQLLCKSLDERNWENAFRAAHTMKGVCMNLGFSVLGQRSSDVTEALRAGKNEEAIALFPALQEAYAAVVNALRTFSGQEA